VRRVFWMALGATAGVLVVRKLTRVAHAYTPAGLAERVEDFGDSLRYFAEQVRLGMTERESELRDALGISAESTSVGSPPPDEAARLIDHPTSPRRSRP
jgi:Family of unknown function (DUF6167)